MALRLTFLFIGLSMLAATSCTKDDDAKKMQEPKSDAADAKQKGSFHHVREESFNKQIKYIKDKKVTAEYWIFYSASGWGPGYGQFTIADNDSGKVTVSYDYKGRQGTLKVDTESLGQIRDKSRNWDTLENVDPPIFDSYKYNYFHLKAKGGNIRELARLYVNAPDLEGKDSLYIDIINTFQNFVTEHDKAEQE